MRWSAIMHVALAVGLFASPARAQRDPAAAEAMFDAAKQALERGEIDTACERFKESHDLDPAVGTLYNLADCEERRGRTGTAWALFVEVRNKIDATDERQGLVVERIKKLEPRLARLTVRLAKDAPANSTVSRAGIKMGAASLGTPVVVDPGSHELVAVAEGYAEQRFSVEVAEAGAAEIQVAPGAKLPPPPPKPASGGPSDEGLGLHPVGLTLLGAGAVGIGVGIGLGFAAKGQYKKVDENCPDNVCDAASFEQRSDAITLSHIATGIFFGGIALAVAGGIVEVVELTSGGDSTEALLLPWAAPTERGWSGGVSGRF